jgi:methionyl-tRNA synthetase
VVSRYHQLWELLNISNDDFIRTTEDRHKAAVGEMIHRIVAAGDIFKADYEGWYCAGAEAFVPDSQVEDGIDTETGYPVERLSEPSWFFRLSAYQDRLLEWYRNNPDCIKPKSRYNEVVRFVEGGLKDLSISRTSISWGVPYPDDPDHVVYVWLDALTNYVSALGFGSSDESLYEQFWPASLHLVGKDILRFHCVYWPAFLMSAGLPLPETVFGHGWWLRDDAKMSKSLGNVVRPDYLIERFGDRCRALLPGARDGLRAGRVILRPGVPGTIQRRPGERPWQHGVTHPVDDEPIPRRRRSRGARRKSHPGGGRKVRRRPTRRG